ncbi:MAG: antitoxin VbhA family protein [Defluviitaleaceae bacterium]|nr:antitoxin VbhA family protein [Defluviitaleaceae bacterium]MCL2240221.1 antitoxin VbhA family protein [Defluviitaleaceae bacterium]
MNKKSNILNEKAWDYAIGIVQVEGIKPSTDFLELAEKEKRGELTNDDIRRVLVKKYTVAGEAVHA